MAPRKKPLSAASKKELSAYEKKLRAADLKKAKAAVRAKAAKDKKTREARAATQDKIWKLQDEASARSKKSTAEKTRKNIKPYARMKIAPKKKKK